MEVAVVTVARVFHGTEVDPFFLLLRENEDPREHRGVGVLTGAALADEIAEVPCSVPRSLPE